MSFDSTKHPEEQQEPLSFSEALALYGGVTEAMSQENWQDEARAWRKRCQEAEALLFSIEGDLNRLMNRPIPPGGTHKDTYGVCTAIVRYRRKHIIHP